MSEGEFFIALAVAVAAGGYIGLVVDRYRRRTKPDEERYPRRWVESVRMPRLHVVDDEWPARKGDG